MSERTPANPEKRADLQERRERQRVEGVKALKEYQRTQSKTLDNMARLRAERLASEKT